MEQSEPIEGPKRALVIGAHPDDPEFACGGTCAKWADEGIEIFYLVCTRGHKGTADPDMTTARLVDLWRHTQGAGAREWTWLSHRRNGFRIDHAFANNTYLKRTRAVCRYDHAPRELGMTDHSAVIVDAQVRQGQTCPDRA